MCGFLTDSLMATITVAGGIWFLQHYKEFVNPTAGGQQPSLTLSSLLSPPTRGPPTEGGPSLPQEIQRAMQSASPQNLGNLPSEQGKRKAVNRGGSIMAHAKVQFIYWGNEWDQANNRQMKTRINDAMQRLFSSSYFDGLAQYGVSKPTIGGIVNNLTYPVPDTTDIPWQEVPNVVLDSIKRLQVPNPDTSPPLANYYFVWVPPGHNIPGYGGLSLYSNTAKGTLFYWGGVVYPSAPHPLIPDILDNITQAFSHECVDALTTGREPAGWVVAPCTDLPGDNHTFNWPASGCGIAQWCGHILKKSPATGNVLVEAYYSNKDNRCIIPGTPLFTGDAKY